MSGPRQVRLYDRDEEDLPAAPSSPSPQLSQELPSGVGTVRGDIGGNIVAVELDRGRLQVVSATALAAQLTNAIQQVQRRATDFRPQRRRRTGKDR